MSQLSPRQRELYDAIRHFIREHTYPPTQRELASSLRCKHHTVQELLRQLEAKGFVTHTPRVARSLRVLNRSAHILSTRVGRHEHTKRAVMAPVAPIEGKQW